VGVDTDDEVVRREAMSMLLEAARVVLDDVLLEPWRPRARCYGDVALGRPFDRLFAACHRHPDRRMRLLDWARPDRYVLVRPELSLVAEDLVGPRAANDLPRLLEPSARIRHRHTVDVVLARDAAGEPRDDATVRHAV